MRSIIKDIGDVGRASDPNSAGIPVGGHPHIVEGVCFTHCIMLITCDFVMRQNLVMI